MPRKGKILDITGHVYGAWTVLGAITDPARKPGSYWLCRCTCGTHKPVYRGSLAAGRSTSCGCLISWKISAALKRHGHAPRRIRTSEYTAWSSMLTRCSNPKCDMFPIYGGRGIRVCDEWKSFDCFLRDMGLKPSRFHSLDRIDPDGNYEPGNCRWASRDEQACNRRDSRRIEYQGKTLALSQWAREINIDPDTLAYRLDHGWSIDRAFGTVVDRSNGGRAGRGIKKRRRPPIT